MRGRGRVSEADHFLSGDAVSSVEVHQPVEGAERLFPDAVLTAPLQHSEMLHPVTVAAKLRGVRTEKGMKAGMHAPFCSNTSANTRAASFFIPPARFFVREFVQTLCAYLCTCGNLQNHPRRSQILRLKPTRT